MKSLQLPGVLALVVSSSALLACGSGKPLSGDEYLLGAPEESALQLGVTDDTTSEGQATESDAVDPTEEVAQSLDEAATPLSGSLAPELAQSRAAVRDLNQALRNFLQPIASLLRDTTPDASVSPKLWGPVTRGATEFRFLMRRGARRHFGWVLEARPAGTDEAFSAVAAGGITVGYVARRGVGTVGVDLDALGAVDPTVVARGSLLASFNHDPDGAELAYRLLGFSADPAKEMPLSALVSGVHLTAGVNRVRLAYYGNLTGTASELPELVLARARHTRGVGGRADVRASGGDIADDKEWQVSECWDATLKSSYRKILECPAGSSPSAACAVVSTSGEGSACAPGMTDAELPPSDPNAPLGGLDSPTAELTPPSAMPDGTPPED